MLNILLIWNRSHRQIGHTIACQKLIFRIGCIAALDGNMQIALDCVFRQCIDVRCDREIGFVVTQRAQIGKGLVHDDDDVGKLLVGGQQCCFFFGCGVGERLCGGCQRGCLYSCGIYFE